jgi:hypothetical protein
MNEITLQAKVRVPAGVIARVGGAGPVILNTGTGKYYSLDVVGTRMWELLGEHGRVDLVYQALLAEYDIGEAPLREDLLGLVRGLVAQQLLEVVG